MRFIKEHYPCPCCGCFTLPGRGQSDICPVCLWEDEPGRSAREQSDKGANNVSLAEAKKNYLAFGACEWEMLPYVCEPLPEEDPIPDNEFCALVAGLNSVLNGLTDKHLNGPNSVFSIHFSKIEWPAPAEIEGPSGLPAEALDRFFKSILDRDAGSVSPGAVRSPGIFSSPVLAVLRPFDPSFYDLSREGIDRYAAKLKTGYCLGMTAVWVGGHWLILYGEWYD